MIGTAMMITVIGQHEEANQLDAMPWQVDRLENGSLRVFGLTLGKTSIQEANQIFARFGENKFQINTDNDGKQSFELFTHYDDLLFDGLIASIKLTYQIDHEELALIYRSLTTPLTKQKTITLPIDKSIEIKYLNSPIASITYIPSIDYEFNSIRQYFGPAATEKSINDDLQIWDYPKMGLQIFIYDNAPDQFIYKPLK